MALAPDCEAHSGRPLGPPALRWDPNALPPPTATPLSLPIRKSATELSLENDYISMFCGKSVKNPGFAVSIELFAVDAILQPCVGPTTLI
jgi:hypothetical protein